MFWRLLRGPLLPLLWRSMPGRHCLFPCGICHNHPGGELPHFSFNLPHPQDLSRDVYTHTHTHTHTGADFLDVQSSNTSCHSCGSGPQSLCPTLSSPGLGLGIPHSLLYAQALRFWGLIPDAQTDGMLPAGPVCKLPKGCPERPLLWQIHSWGPQVYPQPGSWWREDGISIVDLDDSILQGPKVHTRCHVSTAFSSVRTVILSVSIWISHFGWGRGGARDMVKHWRNWTALLGS